VIRSVERNQMSSDELCRACRDPALILFASFVPLFLSLGRLSSCSSRPVSELKSRLVWELLLLGARSDSEPILCDVNAEATRNSHFQMKVCSAARELQRLHMHCWFSLSHLCSLSLPVLFSPVQLMDIDSEHLGIPDTEYKCIVKMPSAEFKRICAEITVMGDTVKISASKDGVKFSAQGDLGTGSITCKQSAGVEDEKDSVQIKLEDDVSLTFALRYLNSFAKATPLSSMVSLKMSPDVPLVVEVRNGMDGMERLSQRVVWLQCDRNSGMYATAVAGVI
jgi:hypothetical protein